MRAIDAKHYLLAVELLKDHVRSFDEYPYALPAVQNLGVLEFHPKVTFFVGENGSGKSTLLEAIAVAWGFNAEGGSKNFNFRTYHSVVSDLHNALRLTRGIRRAKDGYFLRAESYFNVASQIDRLDDEPGPGGKIIGAYGGKSLHNQSHGESFFALLLHRMRGEGLYILDEPEAALSPSRQMAMLARMHDLIQDNSQFIIATHSPIIMAYPDAQIWQITTAGIEKIEYEETEHFKVTRSFLNRPNAMLKTLLSGEN
jgi:predicted ATPase